MATFADLLKKIANNARLTPQELDELGRYGTVIQNSNAFTAGMQTKNVNLEVGEIRADRLFLGKEQYTGIAARYTTGLSVPNSTYTDTTSWNVDYADYGFSTSGGSIRIPETGRYIVTYQVSWDNTASSTGVRDSGAKTNGTPSRPQTAGQAYSPLVYTYLNGYDEVTYNAGDLVKLTNWQNSGATLTLDAWIVFRKIR